MDTVGLFWGGIVRSRLFCEGQISCVRSVLCTPSTARPEGSLQLANDWSQASASAVLHATDGLFWGGIVRSRLFCEGQISCVRSVLCTPSTARPEGSLQLANDWSQASASAVLHATDGTEGTHAAAVCEGKCSSKIER